MSSPWALRETTIVQWFRLVQAVNRIMFASRLDFASLYLKATRRDSFHTNPYKVQIATCRFLSLSICTFSLPSNPEHNMLASHSSIDMYNMAGGQGKVYLYY
jgi:hypothetical protein